MQVKVKLFAMLRERVGKTELIEEVPDDSTVGQVWTVLQTRYPALSGMDIRLVYAVNSDYVDARHVLQDGDEVAFIPPVSGGVSMYQLSDKSLDINEIVALVGDPAAGAIATFIGTTRNHNEGRRIHSLEYEAYPGMAEKEMRIIGEEAAEQWDVTRVAVVHRTGSVPIGEASVVIAVSTAHRDDAFKACRYIIDELKKRVPIWKKEIYEGGEVWIGTQSGEPMSRLPTSA